MDEDKALGESSITDGNSSIDNHQNNNDGSHSNNSNNSNQQPSSSSISSNNADDSDTEDVGWWDCSLCTYRNSTDKFKCEICDLKRGTSTRKPRCNAGTSVDLVKKQQEQIRRQTIVKTPKSTSRPSLIGGTTTPTLTSTPISTTTTNNNNNNDSIVEPVPKAKALPKVIENKSFEMITPLEVNGNVIKYTPPTSTGRTGLIIDKKRFSQHSVTVNDVTITFTEFATRQNKYIRKKKKHRDVSQARTNTTDNDK